MKKPNISSRIMFLLILLLGLTPVYAGITVAPTQYDFGEVEVGSSESNMITLSNDWWGDFTISSVTITQSGSDFILVNPPTAGTVVNPGGTIVFGVEFSPSAEGLVNARVGVRWTNGETGTSYVELSGIGICAQPHTTIEEILYFFDASVGDGSLVGAGPGRSGTHRLHALRNMLRVAANLIGQGNYKGACKQLHAVYNHCDVFASGEALVDLKGMILDLMSELGCI